MDHEFRLNFPKVSPTTVKIYIYLSYSISIPVLNTIVKL